MNKLKFKYKIKCVYVLVFMLIWPSFVFAANDNVETQFNKVDIKNNIKLIEDDLKNMGTSVIGELNKSIEYYKSLLSSEYLNEEQITQINSLISGLHKQIYEYENYTKNLTQNEYKPSEYKIRGIYHVAYSPAVSAVISWFNAQGYVLAAELLTHAKNNNTYNSLYSPVNGSRVKQSPVYKRIIGLSATSGKAAFPNSGTVVQKDLYYAIHGFSWTKHGYGKITILDKYDFAKGQYSGIAGIAVNTMYEAQQHGVIVPYGVKITN